MILQFAIHRANSYLYGNFREVISNAGGIDLVGIMEMRVDILMEKVLSLFNGAQFFYL